MGEIFFIGDTHLGHKNVLKFERSPGVPLRDFRDLNHMHETIIENWCKVVRPQDKIYHLGDVAFSLESLDILRSLPGHKRLIRGNHDLFQTPVYLKYFEEIYGVRQINGIWLTHIPMHPMNLYRAKLNIHGHTHANRVMTTTSSYVEDSRYYNVSVECINYTPVSLDQIQKECNIK